MRPFERHPFCGARFFRTEDYPAQQIEASGIGILAFRDIPQALYGSQRRGAKKTAFRNRKVFTAGNRPVMFPADYNPPGFAVFGREEDRTLFPDPAEPVFRIPF